MTYSHAGGRSSLPTKPVPIRFVVPPPIHEREPAALALLSPERARGAPRRRPPWASGPLFRSIPKAGRSGSLLV